MVLYIIRHGNPDYEHDTLTPLGEKEAEALGERMKKEAPDLIYMSPRGRAIATAKPTCQKTGLTGSIENWMTERNEYMYSPDFSKQEARDAGYSFSLKNGVENMRDFCPEAGRESLIAELIASSDAFLERHGYRREGGLYRMIRPNDLRIACFCHGGFGGTWIAHLFGMMPVMAWLKLDLHTASVTRFDFRDEFDSGYATARCSYINDISHLKAAGLAEHKE